MVYLYYRYNLSVYSDILSVCVPVYSLFYYLTVSVANHIMVCRYPYPPPQTWCVHT